jgi:CheY-like chemotaxis protein
MVTKGSVLVVDDEINLCRILGAKLAKSGYNVVAVHDGLQAVEKVRESNFDVVLLDLILPKMDGLTALAEIRSMRSALPVIVMTACENAETLAQAQTYGVQGYVNKPFDLDNLVSLVSGTSVSSDTVRQGAMPTASVLFCKNQGVMLEVQNGSRKVYAGHIYDKDDRTLSVRLKRESVEIAPHSAVKCSLSAVDAHYSFTSRILRTSHESKPLVIMDKPGVIYRIQRRVHNRCLMRVPATLHFPGDFKAVLGETRDLSMGGMSVIVPEEIIAGDMLSVELWPKTAGDKVKVTAQVLRSKPSDEGRGYLLGCRFTRIDETLRKLLGS